MKLISKNKKTHFKLRLKIMNNKLVAKELIKIAKSLISTQLTRTDKDYFATFDGNELTDEQKEEIIGVMEYLLQHTDSINIANNERELFPLFERIGMNDYDSQIKRHCPLSWSLTCHLRS